MTPLLDLAQDHDLAIALDRLVAGELADAERRALLGKLESTPDGWRRCALAFLEEQAWRTALGSAEVFETRTPQPKTTRRRRPALVIIPYALAASLISLFALTLYRSSVPQVERPDPVAMATPKPAATQVPEGFDPAPGQPIGWVGLTRPDDGEALPQPVPILAATAANQQWLQDQPATIPDYVRAVWERRGYQVEENHRLVELGLQDGQPVGIPIDEVELDFVGRQPL